MAQPDPRHDPVRPVVVFDLGGVLVDWDPFPAVAAGVGEDEARLFFEAFDFLAWNLQLDGGRPILEAEDEAAVTSPRWADHLRSYRLHFPAALVGQHDGSVEVLRELAAAGVPLYALTNWPAELFPAARERYAWLGLFRDVVVSGEEGHAKPDPVVFDILRSRIAEDGAEAVFVDDVPVNVAAARASGFDGLVFTDPDRLRAELRARGLPV